jgi:hypothetical protein
LPEERVKGKGHERIPLFFTEEEKRCNKCNILYLSGSAGGGMVQRGATERKTVYLPCGDVTAEIPE